MKYYLRRWSNMLKSDIVITFPQLQGLEEPTFCYILGTEYVAVVVKDTLVKIYLWDGFSESWYSVKVLEKIDNWKPTGKNVS